MDSHCTGCRCRCDGRGKNSQTSTKQTKAQPNKKTVKCAERICAMKCLLKIDRYGKTFHHISRQYFVSGSSVRCFPSISARITSAEELGPMSKNNAGGIRPALRIHPINLMFSWFSKSLHGFFVSCFLAVAH